MLEKFKKSKKRRCLNCEQLLPDGWNDIFCHSCAPKIEDESKSKIGTDTLPENLVEDIIADMPEGKVFYTVPWSMFADPWRKLFIVGVYSYDTAAHGTVSMRIMKKNGKILVDQSSIRNEKYHQGKPCYVGVSESDYIPITLVPRF